MTIIKSKFPDLDIPVTDAYSYIFQHVERYSDFTALIDPTSGTKITFGQLNESILQLSNGLSTRLDKGDVVAILAPNHINYATAVFGVLKAGGCVTTLNPAYTLREIQHQLEDSKAKFLFTVGSLSTQAIEAAALVNIPIQNIFHLDDSSGSPDLPAPMSSLYSNIPPVSPVVFSKDDLFKTPAYLCYSSGTTGKSKGVMTSHMNMVSNVCQVDGFEGHEYTSGKDVLVGILPMFHMFGLHILLHFALLRGLSVVVISKFDFVNFIKYIETYKISTAHIVPPIAVGLAKHPAVEQADLSSCRVFFSGAAPLSDSLASAIKTRTGIPIKQGYGMTEMTPAHCIGETNNIVDGSSGVLLPNCLARIVDLEGDDVETGKEGELWAKGPHIMIGYLNNDKATPETIDKDGWLHTGDIARIDADGNLFIVDRLKELIKYKGFQVPPAELEALLLTHPAIADAAVIGIPNEEAGELPRAYVVLKQDAAAAATTEAQVMEFISAKVAHHKRLRGGVEFISQVPKSASGKILRRVLRDEVKAKSPA